ncbi:hypothetical protein [Nitrospina watsonii]|uniref:Uncharacterized protein n=1 Tax=Nitrospina watsonii TaxID=1323948 RepID=A0ABM9HDV6_9BACT|nr:hypothetical protein [Nitrospina watsonii]CAI2718372.1 conserved protein of unknown function [Nitrospina watsonii]
MTQDTIRFEEGKPCPVQVQGSGGGLSVSANGDMLLVGAFPNPTEEQVEAWCGKWRAKLITESEFPAIPIFAIGSEDWILETPCNPCDNEKEAPGFCEALYAKDDVSMAAVLVDSETGLIRKITQVPLDEMFIERLVLSWNPFRFEANDYNKAYTTAEFTEKVTNVFKMRSSRELWTTSW